MEQDVLTLLIKHMEDDKQAFMVAVTRGAPKDFAEYQSICGQIRGIVSCQGRVHDMIQRLKQESD
jgi:hypothetical protein